MLTFLGSTQSSGVHSHDLKKCLQNTAGGICSSTNEHAQNANGLVIVDVFILLNLHQFGTETVWRSARFYLLVKGSQESPVQGRLSFLQVRSSLDPRLESLWQFF